MPMSPRLLRPRASSALVAVDADARAYINAVRTADGGQYMEPAVQLAIDAFVAGCKTDGIWTAIKASCILMGARTLSGCLTPLVGSAPTNTNFVSGDYDRKTGLLGNGTNKFLDTNYNNASDGQNDQHIALYISASAGANQATMFGAGTSGTSGSSGIGQINTMVVRSRGGNQTLSALAGATGFFGKSRAASDVFTGRVGGSTTTITGAGASQTPFSATHHVFKTNGSAVHSTVGLSFYSTGGAVDLVLLDSRVTTLHNAIGAAI